MIQLFNEKGIGSPGSDRVDGEGDENDDDSSTHSNNEKNLVQSIFSRLVVI